MSEGARGTDREETGSSLEQDTYTIEVSKRVYERFEEERKQTGNVHVPPMQPETFVSSLLDTVEAVREGYYEE